jgi:uncharacterized small protein (DUF1192 family)
MDADEIDSRREKIAPKDLEPMSVDELNRYILDLETEIARARAAIGAKQGIRAGAESLFRR